MKSKGKFLVLSLALLLAVASSTAWADAGAEISITVTPQTSTGGIAPTSPGGSEAANTRFYNYMGIAPGGMVNDTIPVQVCISSITINHLGFAWAFSVSFGPDGAAGNLDGVDLDATASFSSGAGDGVNTCKTLNIPISSPALSDLVADGADFTKNIKVDATGTTGTGHSRTDVNVGGLSKLKVRVFVEAPAIVCFVTDSSFNFLFLCDGTTEVTEGTDGRFAIVTNKKGTEVATNPGQFYYHVLWTNDTGSDQTITVNFTRNGVNPQGAQAIHAGLFPPPFSGVDLDGFNTVNDAIPSGSDDVLESVNVPDGWTLWVTYHLEWAGLGSPAPGGATNVCEDANQNWSVTATLSGGASGSCTAGAKGYLKK